MRKKYILLLLILITLTLLSGVYVVGGTQAYSRYQQNSLANQEYCGGQAPVHICVRTPSTIFSAFYPSYLASQYPFFTIDYSSSSPLTLLISVTITRFSQTQTQTVNAIDISQFSNFIPPLLDEVLQKLTTDETTSLHVEITDTRQHLYYVNDMPLILHSRWLMQWIAANRLKIAAWVTPNDPKIAELLIRAETHLPNQQTPVPQGMVGYKTATPQQVIDQVDAIYEALRLDYHIHYVQASIPYSSAEADNVSTQVIKLPAEVLQQRSGMCVELTTLMASAVERIGLHSRIIIIPGHAFLGISVTEDDKHIEYWDGVDVNNNVAADSANVQADNVYKQNVQQNTIVDTILLSEARQAHVGPML
jgi:hypothetical protein